MRTSDAGPASASSFNLKYLLVYLWSSCALISSSSFFNPFCLSSNNGLGFMKHETQQNVACIINIKGRTKRYKQDDTACIFSFRHAFTKAVLPLHLRSERHKFKTGHNFSPATLRCSPFVIILKVYLRNL